MPPSATLRREVAKKMASLHTLLGIQRAEPGIVDSGLNFEGTMPRPVTIALLTDMVNDSAILSAIDFKRVTHSTGDVRILEFDSPVAHADFENVDTASPRKPTSRVVPYTLRKIRADIYFTWEELEQAAEDGMTNFEDNIMSMFRQNLSNDLAHLAVRGDTTISSESNDPWDQLLRCTDGLLKHLESANIYDRAGKGPGIGMFHVFKRSIKSRYLKNPASFRWILNSTVIDIWRMAFAHLRQTAEGDRRLSNETYETPAGIKPFVTDTILDDMGPSSAPTSVSDDADGTMTVRVNSILNDATDYSGRQVEITCKATGLSEKCAVDYNGSSQNIIETAGSLGQDTISTSASDYTVKVVDQTEIAFGNPKTFAFLTKDNNWRVAYEYNKDFDRYEYTMRFMVGSLLPMLDPWAKMKNLTIPQITDFAEWTGWTSS